MIDDAKRQQLKQLTSWRVRTIRNDGYLIMNAHHGRPKQTAGSTRIHRCRLKETCNEAQTQTSLNKYVLARRQLDFVLYAEFHQELFCNTEII
jgi:hypothetical protein